MRLVHICLDLEYKGGEVFVVGIDLLSPCIAGQGWRRQFQESFQEWLHAEVGQCGTEEYRRQPPFLHCLQVECIACPVQQLHILQQGVPVFRADEPVQLRRMEIHLRCLDLVLPIVGFKGENVPFFPVEYPLEFLAAADGPVHRIGLDAQLLLNLLQQVKGVPGFPIHFVDKGKNGNMTHDADLKQLPGLVLHALGSVDDHHCGVCRHQSSVGIL